MEPNIGINKAGMTMAKPIPHVAVLIETSRSVAVQGRPRRATLLNGMPLSLCAALQRFSCPPQKKNRIPWESGQKSLAGDEIWPELDPGARLFQKGIRQSGSGQFGLCGAAEKGQ